MTQTVTVTIARFNGLSDKFFALKKMGTLPFNLEKISGLQFSRLMGCGAGNGFRLTPDLSQYIFLGVWDTEKDADCFFKTNQTFSVYLDRTSSFQHLYMHTLKSHGLWSSRQPFIPESFPTDNPYLAVLTRATIKWSQVVKFRNEIPDVVKNLKTHHTPLIAVGIGEYPLRYQATFSIWPSVKAMHAFAYKDDSHIQMIRKTKDTGWYAEDLFARFKIFRTEGENIVPLPDL